LAGEKKYSYIKYPYSKNGWICFALALISAALTITVLALSIARYGQTTRFTGPCGITALIASIMGLWFAFLSFGEKEKNYLFAFIGGGLSLLLAIAWVLIVIGGSS